MNFQYIWGYIHSKMHKENIYVNQPTFADDLRVLSPSISGLQHCLNMCYDYPVEHEIVFNHGCWWYRFST